MVSRRCVEAARARYRPARAGSRPAVQPRPLSKIPALVLAPRPEQRPHALRPEPVELIDGPQHRQPPPRVLGAAEADGFHHAVEHLAVVDLHDIGPARDAERLHAVRRHHADLGVRRRGRRPHRVGVELHELAEPARTRLLVAEHPAGAIAAIGLGQPLVVLRDIAGERRGQVVAQRQPLLVVVLEREHALVRPVEIGQELAERLRVFDERRLHRLEAIKRVDLADLAHHRLGGGDVGAIAVDEAARAGGVDLVVAHVRTFACSSWRAKRSHPVSEIDDKSESAAAAEPWIASLRSQ